VSSRAQRGTFVSWRLPDLSRTVLVAVAALLVLMIALPIGWLVVYSLSDKAGHATLGNFVALFTDPTFVDPLIPPLIIPFSVSAICCAVAAPLGWLVARTDMPIRRTVRTLVMASLVTPPFVGAIAWEMLAAPNSGLLNQLWRALTGMPADEALLDIYNLPGLIFVITCYTFPYVFILVANALDRMPGELADASFMLGVKTWQPARRITVPLALPTCSPGADRLPAGAEPVRRARDPGHSRGLPHAHHPHLEPVPVPAQARACRRRLAAAAAAHHRAAARPVAGARPPRLCRAGRQVRPAAPRAAGLAALARRGLPCWCSPCRSSCPTPRCSTRPFRASPPSS
jgi:ABC-type sugar transport system permease subunit